MAKFSGNIGFAKLVETSPGVWKEEIIEKHYCGDFPRNRINFQTTDKVNDNVNISNEISIVSNPFLRENFHLIRYVVYAGVKWKITGVDVKYPRLILTIGGCYNGE